MRTNLASNGALCLHPYLWGVIYEYYHKHSLENNRKFCFIIIYIIEFRSVHIPYYYI